MIPSLLSILHALPGWVQFAFWICLIVVAGALVVAQFRGE